MIPKDVKGICELFDCAVCNDLSAKGFSKELQTIYYIGTYPELSAGLYGYSLTKGFFSMKALERYCASAKGRNEINLKAKETFTDWLYDYQDWFNNICDGCFDIRGINASEHKCHTWDTMGNKVSEYFLHKGEKINSECSCPQCKIKKRTLIT
jgi:hypothetical protein